MRVVMSLFIQSQKMKARRRVSQPGKGVYWLPLSLEEKKIREKLDWELYKLRLSGFPWR